MRLPGDRIFLYDTSTGRTRRLGKVNNPLLLPVARFDPTGQVLAAAYSPDSVNQRPVTWDVASGHQRDDVAVPGGEMDEVHDMWPPAGDPAPDELHFPDPPG